jgi:hypothetical protein
MRTLPRPLAALAAVLGVAAVVGITVAARRALDADSTAGWSLAGSTPQDYDTTVDPAVTYAGRPSVRIATVYPPRGSGTLMRAVGAEPYRGKRVRLTGAIRARAAVSGASLWIGVDDPCGRVVTIDNARDRAVRGTTAEWRRQDIVLDVAPNAVQISFGLLLVGGGTAWANDVRLEVVPPDVPVTAAPSPGQGECARTRPVDLPFPASHDRAGWDSLLRAGRAAPGPVR